jgi:predicted  nucleic acid-binding Zn-ribbon protein
MSSREHSYVDDERLAALLANEVVSVDYWDLARTLQEDRKEARENATRAANHIEELVGAARADTERIDHLELDVSSSRAAHTALSNATDEIAEERDALREQVAELTRTGPVQLIFKVEGDVHVSTKEPPVIDVKDVSGEIDSVVEG